jgi:2-polyprenyl-6-methoxyphenol hydroxylase-like FAD-dependent oxidoreductase
MRQAGAGQVRGWGGTAVTVVRHSRWLAFSADGWPGYQTFALLCAAAGGLWAALEGGSSRWRGQWVQDPEALCQSVWRGGTDEVEAALPQAALVVVAVWSARSMAGAGPISHLSQTACPCTHRLALCCRDAAHPMTPNLGQGGCVALEVGALCMLPLAPLRPLLSASEPALTTLL